RHPVGMAAGRLEVETHVVTAGRSFLQNLARCVEAAEVDVDDIVATPLASGIAVATEAEQALGVLVIDLGGGATHLAAFADGCVRHVSTLPVGGGHLSHDLAVGLRIPLEQAERLKRESGCATSARASSEYVSIRPMNEEDPVEVPRRVLAEILEPRVAEIAG